MAELGNLTGGILLSPGRMSTVKIRAGSLFRTPLVPDWGWGAGFGAEKITGKAMPERWDAVMQAGSGFSSALHRLAHPCTGCTQASGVSHLREAGVRVQSQSIRVSTVEVGFEVDQNSSRRLPALRRHGMEDAPRQPQRAQGSAGHALRLPTAGAGRSLAGCRAHSAALRTL